MSYFSIFDTSSTPVKDRKKRYLFLLINAIVLSWAVWCIVNFRNYAALPNTLKLSSMVLSLAGRLEIYPLLLAFRRRF